MDSLPAGWKFSKSAGSPLVGYEFASNGSPLRGGKIALVRVGSRAIEQAAEEPHDIHPKKESGKSNSLRHDFVFDKSQSRTVNDLARQKFKERMLRDILVDLTICDIEGWDKLEYIKELKRLLNGIKLNSSKSKTESPQLF